MKPHGELAIIHVKSPETIKAIHTTVGGAIANDCFPQLSELVPMVEKVGFEIVHSESEIGLCLIGRKNTRQTEL